MYFNFLMPSGVKLHKFVNLLLYSMSLFSFHHTLSLHDALPIFLYGLAEWLSARTAMPGVPGSNPVQSAVRYDCVAVVKCVILRPCWKTIIFNCTVLCCSH